MGFQGKNLCILKVSFSDFDKAKIAKGPGVGFVCEGCNLELNILVREGYNLDSICAKFKGFS